MDDIVITDSDQDGIWKLKQVLSGLLDCKPIDISIDPNVKLVPRQGEHLRDSGIYQEVV